MTTVAAKPGAPVAGEWHRPNRARRRGRNWEPDMTAEPGSWWLVLLDGLAGQAARVAEADRGEQQRVVPHVADCGDGLLPPPRPFATAIAVTNAVTVILTFTTASQ